MDDKSREINKCQTMPYKPCSGVWGIFFRQMKANGDMQRCDVIRIIA